MLQGDPGMHAWDTMLKAYLDPNNSHLEDISEELTKYQLSSMTKKKDGPYLIALINVGMMQRCGKFLEEWETLGPKSVGLSSAHHGAPTEDKAKERRVPLITDATKDSKLHSLMRDLQIMGTDKLLAYTNGLYLKVLKEAGAEGLVQ